MSTLIRVEDEYGSYEVSSNDSVVEFDKFMERLVIPVCLAMGYHAKTISDYMGE